MRAVLDTSVLIAGDRPGAVEAAISVASLAELHFGALVTRILTNARAAYDGWGLSRRRWIRFRSMRRIGREWGRLSAAVAQRGGRPRRRTMDLAIAATANAHGVPLFTHDLTDFRIIEDLVDVRAP